MYRNIEEDCSVLEDNKEYRKCAKKYERLLIS